jgi:hypothetical protein
VFLDQKFPGLPVDSSTLSWKADPAGGLTTIEQNGGGFVPAFKRGQLWVPLCTVFDTTTDPVTVNHFPTYSLNGSQRIEFETIDGDMFTVLGMPLLPVLGALRELGELPS